MVTATKTIKEGSKVIFTNKNGRIKGGVVKNLNFTPTAALVEAPDGRNWRVPLSELTVFEPTATTAKMPEKR